MVIDLIMIIKLIFVNKEDPLVSSHKGCIKGGIENSFLVGLAETLPLPFFLGPRKVGYHGSVLRGTTNLREVYHGVRLALHECTMGYN